MTEQELQAIEAHLRQYPPGPLRDNAVLLLVEVHRLRIIIEEWAEALEDNQQPYWAKAMRAELAECQP